VPSSLVEVATLCRRCLVVVAGVGRGLRQRARLCLRGVGDSLLECPRTSSFKCFVGGVGLVLELWALACAGGACGHCVSDSRLRVQGKPIRRCFVCLFFVIVSFVLCPGACDCEECVCE
jgi:hypothetical protein